MAIVAAAYTHRALATRLLGRPLLLLRLPSFSPVTHCQNPCDVLRLRGPLVSPVSRSNALNCVSDGSSKQLQTTDRYSSLAFVRRMAMAGIEGSASDVSAVNVAPEDVLQYWFKDLDITNNIYPTEFWFIGGEAIVKEVTEKFGDCLELACSGKLDSWQSTPQGRVALVIVLDQFSRMVFRNTPRAFAQDQVAQNLTLDTIKQGWDKELGPFERNFLYMPLMHSESLEVHEEADRLYEANASNHQDNPELHRALKNTLQFERAHRGILKKFGRYPIRNVVLGRKNSPEEEEYLASGITWPTPDS